MTQTVRLDELSYELGVLMAMGYHREDNSLQDTVQAMLMTIDETLLDVERMKQGIRNELMDYTTEYSIEQVMLNVLVDYFEGTSSIVSDAIVEIVNDEEGGTALFSEEAIAIWASDVFSQVTDYAAVEEADLSFEQIGIELQGYDDLEQSNLEGEINRQLQAAGYIYSTETCQWKKNH